MTIFYIELCGFFQRACRGEPDFSPCMIGCQIPVRAYILIISPDRLFAREGIVGKKILLVENFHGPFQIVFQRVLRVVPDRDRNDDRLRRLVAFRLRNDGEAATSEYLMRNIRKFLHSRHKGQFYDFLTQGANARAKSRGREPDPPGAA